MTETENLQLSDQAVGALMMALQRSLMDQSDIVPIIKGFKLKDSEAGLMVMNPPMIKFDNKVSEEDDA
jgi:hypothetical protein|tara:strand:+ start:315 stop:518 length:204 start_codon:yes stop_codon:yes gene_type:complete